MPPMLSVRFRRPATVSGTDYAPGDTAEFTDDVARFLCINGYAGRGTTLPDPGPAGGVPPRYLVLAASAAVPAGTPDGTLIVRIPD